MKFFIDTADVREVKEAASMGLVDGVTTNPSLVAKTGKKFREAGFRAEADGASPRAQGCLWAGLDTAVTEEWRRCCDGDR